MPNIVFEKLYSELEPKVISFPNEMIYDFKENTDYMYIVRQGKLIEEH